jgi:hypothetical protein
MFIWYIFPVLECCAKKNLATPICKSLSFLSAGFSNSPAGFSARVVLLLPMHALQGPGRVRDAHLGRQVSSRVARCFCFQTKKNKFG